MDAVAVAKEAQQAQQDQVDCHDEVQQARHEQNQDAGDQGHDRADGQGEGHDRDLDGLGGKTFQQRPGSVPFPDA